ncbi:unnamed protein product [Protopolystoma xenopodis]|uniref:Uncharacterized protein n=1 Tax=Protopolystoma xenopodis TaxID=117903 RepID=A0A448X062_9PLAT|nr:unnamed protein product [Protopolystoma xenopodis]
MAFHLPHPVFPTTRRSPLQYLFLRYVFFPCFLLLKTHNHSFSHHYPFLRYLFLLYYHDSSEYLKPNDLVRICLICLRLPWLSRLRYLAARLLAYAALLRPSDILNYALTLLLARITQPNDPNFAHLLSLSQNDAFSSNGKVEMEKQQAIDKEDLPKVVLQDKSPTESNLQDVDIKTLASNMMKDSFLPVMADKHEMPIQMQMINQDSVKSDETNFITSRINKQDDMNVQNYTNPSMPQNQADSQLCNDIGQLGALEALICILFLWWLACIS